MENILRTKVYYGDTDAYGVVWHGTYLRWMEMGRTNFSDQQGLTLSVLQQQGIILPVVEINVRYKYSAKLDEEISIETKVESVSAASMTFIQTIKSLSTNKVCVVAKVKVVAVNEEGILYRRLPKILSDAFNCEKINV